MFNTDWDVEKYKTGYEPEEHWKLRRQFMLAHKNNYPEEKLVCLTQVFFNMEFLGCKYPEETMETVNGMAAMVAEEFREARKGKLKRTFVGAKDAAGAKAKGGKPPSGVTEGASTQQQQSREQPPPYKRSRFDDSGPSRGQHSDNGGPSRRQYSDYNTPSRQQYSDNKNSSTRGSDSKPYSKAFQDIPADLGEVFKDFVLMIPIRSNSKTEEDTIKIVNHNFPDGKVSFQMSGDKKSEFYSCTVKLNPDPNSKQKPQYQITSVSSSVYKECRHQAAADSIEKLKSVCTIIEPNPDWFQEGGTPEFIRRRIPCTKTPRSYLIMTKKDTGHITPQVADMLMDNFSRSSNEDMFFIDTEYNEKEKKFLLERSQAHNLGVRHFGSGVQLSEHHVCIYKKRTAQEIMDEARSLGWKHPKYLIRPKDSFTSEKTSRRPN